MLYAMSAPDPWQFIDATAEKLGVTAEALRKWHERGVPHRWRLPIVDAAKRAKIKFDTAAFDTPPRKTAA